MDPEPFVDADRAADFLGLTRRRILKMVRAGEIPGHPIGMGRRLTWRFRLSEVAQAILVRRVAQIDRDHDMIQSGGPQAVPAKKGY